MIRWLVLVFILMLCGTVAQADVVAVRSGEHDGFTRLVMPVAGDRGWTLRRDAEGYVLGVDGAPEFDLRGAFRLIGRQRIADMTAQSAGLLRVALGCDCHANAFQTAGGLLVVDIADGPADPRSPFEAAAAAEAAETVVAAQSDLPPFWTRAAQSEPGVGSLRPTSPILAKVAALTTDRSEAMARLLEWQISRAMGQGLVEPGDAGDRVDGSRGTSAPTRADGPDMPDHLAEHLGAATAIDLALAPERPTGGSDASCPPDGSLAIADWSPEHGLADALAMSRGQLVGEFDRPDEAEVLRQARLYLHFGFGAEAQALMRSMKPSAPEAAHLAAIAATMDGGFGTGGLFRLLADCPGEAMLWAVLDDPENARGADRRGVVRSFSRLPMHLRQHLGPRLADAMLAAADPAMARLVHAAMARSTGSGSPQEVFVDARIDAGSLAPAPPVALVDTLAAQGENLPDAVILSVETYLKSGKPVPEALTDLTGSLAFERRWTRDAPALLRVHALGLISRGDFPGAIAAADALARRMPARAGDTLSAVLTALTQRAPDEVFLKTYFARAPDFQGTASLARLTDQRLALLGFDDAAGAGTDGSDPARRSPSGGLRADADAQPGTGASDPDGPAPTDSNDGPLGRSRQLLEDTKALRARLEAALAPATGASPGP